MSINTTARGQSTRQANKERRKQKILGVTRELIASERFDALTISELASGCLFELTEPTHIRCIALPAFAIKHNNA